MSLSSSPVSIASTIFELLNDYTSNQLGIVTDPYKGGFFYFSASGALVDGLVYGSNRTTGGYWIRDIHKNFKLALRGLKNLLISTIPILSIQHFNLQLLMGTQ